MILTVKLGNLHYETLAIELPQKYIDSDQDYLNIINDLARKKIWEDIFDLECRRKYKGDYAQFPAPPIVMMYSRNRHNF